MVNCSDLIQGVAWHYDADLKPTFSSGSILKNSNTEDTVWVWKGFPGFTSDLYQTHSEKVQIRIFSKRWNVFKEASTSNINIGQQIEWLEEVKSFTSLNTAWFTPAALCLYFFSSLRITDMFSSCSGYYILKKFTQASAHTMYTNHIALREKMTL